MSIHKYSVDSKSEMIEYLRKCDTKQVLLGKSSEVEGGGYIFQVELDGVKIITVGIITEGHGLQPECKYLNDKLLIGFNKEVHVIDINNNVDNILCADSLFYEFSSEILENSIVAIFELEIICFSVDGKILWKYSTDIINDYHAENDVIYLTTDSGDLSLSLLTGEKI